MTLTFKQENHVTVCTQCTHFLNLEPGSPRQDVWYNHVCEAMPLPMKVDPYDGEEKPCDRNDLGTEIFTSNKFRFCRDVNNGKCQKFEA